MVFSSYLFLFFFLPAVLAGYYLAPRKWKHTVLTLYGHLFYGPAKASAGKNGLCAEPPVAMCRYVGGNGGSRVADARLIVDAVDRGSGIKVVLVHGYILLSFYRLAYIISTIHKAMRALSTTRRDISKFGAPPKDGDSFPENRTRQRSARAFAKKRDTCILL